MAAHQLEEVLAGMMGCSSNKNNIDQQLEEEEEEKKGMSRPPSLEKALKCPRCDSTNTKFCYYNNYSLSQPRYLCKGCRRYWTQGGSLRNIPVGGGCRKDKRSPSSKKAQERRRHTHQSLAASAAAAANNSNPNRSLNSSAGAGILSILRGGGGGFLDRHSNRKNRYDDNASDYAHAPGGNSMMRSSLEGGNVSVGNATLTAGAEGYSWTNHGNNVAVESTREYYWIDGVSSYWYGLDHQ